jgi:hypothetical protein
MDVVLSIVQSYDSRAEDEKTSEEARDSIHLKDKAEANSPDLIGLQELHLLRTFVEVVSQRQHIIQFKDASVLRPAFDVDRLRSLQHLSDSRNVY